jgi:uncharacterized circularly permuted ATP-grasp superfamily protein
VSIRTRARGPRLEAPIAQESGPTAIPASDPASKTDRLETKKPDHARLLGQERAPSPTQASKAPKSTLLEARRLSVSRDEALDRRGSVRPQYKSVWSLARAMSAARKQRALRASRQEFRGDNALHSVPRILTASEYGSLKKGVIQRGTALRMFLEDHYSGKKSYTKIIPKDVVDEIIARNRESMYDGLLDPKQISFPYGPDIMRAKDGKFYVIEDNTGFIGGPGDLVKAREVLFQIEPGYRDALQPVDDPSEYYQRIVERAKDRANPAGGRIVMYMVPPYADHEDGRLRKIMQSVGVDVITPNTKNRLVVNDHGVFIREKIKEGAEKLHRVGFVFLNGEHRWIDASHPATRGAYLLGEADERLHDPKLNEKKRTRLEAALAPDPATGKVDFVNLEAEMKDMGLLASEDLRWASTGKGLMEAMFQSKVATNYSPGLDFVGDKAFKGYVDDLVRFYLNEEPVLKSIPVHRFTKRTKDGLEVVDDSAVKKLFDDEAYKSYVFKVVDGRGGKGVYIGPKMKKAEVPMLVSRIRSEPERYVAEPFTPLSTLDGHIVDLRLISMVDPNEVVVSPTPWGRGVPVDGDGKVNLSQKGKEFAVVVVEDPTPPVEAKSYRAPTRGRGVGLRQPKLRTRSA